jgi:hypothetical protein
MPLKNYGVPVGRSSGESCGGRRQRHSFQVPVRGSATALRTAVNEHCPRKGVGAAEFRRRTYALGQRWAQNQASQTRSLVSSPAMGCRTCSEPGHSIEFVRDNGVWQEGALLLHFPTMAQ